MTYQLATCFARSAHQISGREALDNEALFRHVPSIFAPRADWQPVSSLCLYADDRHRRAVAAGRVVLLRSREQDAGHLGLTYLL
ncbi:hypothetical protein [Ciceribacter selenitireducens]